MKVYKITYRIFGYIRGLDGETSHANVKADNENDAIEKLKKALKLNGHRLNKIMSVEVINNPNGVMSDVQNGIK